MSIGGPWNNCHLMSSGISTQPTQITPMKSPNWRLLVSKCGAPATKDETPTGGQRERVYRRRGVEIAHRPRQPYLPRLRVADMRERRRQQLNVIRRRVSFDESGIRSQPALASAA
uniref:Uncharacterized protein n=1 Tax=Anopheles quadriannulatus TaxID=34691 RepID=A0A182WX91_ANOQN